MRQIDSQQLSAEARRGARFLAVGFGGLAVDSSVFLILNGHGVDKPAARAASLVCATFVTWASNRAFTFGASGRSRREELARYGLVALGAQGFNYALFLGFCALAPQVHPLPLIVVSAATAAVFSYAGQRFFTFAGEPAQPL
jgi:putative flippase GtrA